MTVGEKIRQIRKDKGITQDELAKKLGISRPAVGQFEKETSHPRIETLQKIADALGVPVYEFSFNEGERIKTIRETKGLSQEDLGKIIGLSGAQINEIENLIQRPSNSMIIRLASALDVPYSDLVPGSIADHVDEEDNNPKINNANDGLKAIIRKLYECEDMESINYSNRSNASGLHFVKDDISYIFTDEDFYDLIPLVDSLIYAYVEQKKVAV